MKLICCQQYFYKLKIKSTVIEIKKNYIKQYKIHLYIITVVKIYIFKAIGGPRVFPAQSPHQTRQQGLQHLTRNQHNRHQEAPHEMPRKPATPTIKQNTEHESDHIRSPAHPMKQRITSDTQHGTPRQRTKPRPHKMQDPHNQVPNLSPT